MSAMLSPTARPSVLRSSLTMPTRWAHRRPGEAQPEGVADVPVLVKPFGSLELARAIRDCLDETVA